MELELYLDREEKTLALGELVGRNLPLPGTVYLEGDLGTGKTYFSKGIAKGCLITEEVTSPTFTLINEYFSEKVKLFHLDLYRLDNLKQVLNLGIEDFIDSPESVVLIEWAEKLENYPLSDSILKVKILHDGKGRRFFISSDSDRFKETLEEIRNFADTGN
jgi:tRNA threonylcarbamoyladenosine biosynthesis protein TsaE